MANRDWIDRVSNPMLDAFMKRSDPKYGFNDFANHFEPIPERGYLDAFLSGAKEQGAGVLQGQAEFLNTLGIGDGDSANYFNRVMQNNARRRNYTWEDMVDDPWKYITDPEGLAFDLGGGTGSSGVLLTETAATGGVGGAVARAVGLAGKIGSTARMVAAITDVAGEKAPWLIKALKAPAGKLLVANVMKTPLEAASEGGNIARDIRESGGSHDEQLSGMLKGTALNMATLAFTNSLESAGLGKMLEGLGGKKAVSDLTGEVIQEASKKASDPGFVQKHLMPSLKAGYEAGKALTGMGLQNAYEEGTQESISQYAKGEKDSLVDVFNPAQWNDEAKTAAAIGGVTGIGQGGIMTGIGKGVNYMFGEKEDKQQELKTPNEEAIKDLSDDEIFEAATSMGASDELLGAIAEDLKNGDREAAARKFVELNGVETTASPLRPIEGQRQDAPNPLYGTGVAESDNVPPKKIGAPAEGIVNDNTKEIKKAEKLAKGKYYPQVTPAPKPDEWKNREEQDLSKPHDRQGRPLQMQDKDIDVVGFIEKTQNAGTAELLTMLEGNTNNSIYKPIIQSELTKRGDERWSKFDEEQTQRAILDLDDNSLFDLIRETDGSDRWGAFARVVAQRRGYHLTDGTLDTMLQGSTSRDTMQGRNLPIVRAPNLPPAPKAPNTKDKIKRAVSDPRQQKVAYKALSGDKESQNSFKTMLPFKTKVAILSNALSGTPANKDLSILFSRVLKQHENGDKEATQKLRAMGISKAVLNAVNGSPIPNRPNMGKTGESVRPIDEVPGTYPRGITPPMQADGSTPLRVPEVSEEAVAEGHLSEGIIEEPKVEEKPAKGNEQKSVGNSVQLVTDDGTKINARYKLVDAKDLTLSNDPVTFAKNSKYPQELQPRNRTSAVMQAQVPVMAKNLDPALLTESLYLNQGAPVVDGNNVVYNGNGRAMAIIQSIATGKYNAYKKYLFDNAEKYGLTQDDFKEVKTPVLVREVEGEIPVSKIINSTSGGATPTATEQAESDAKAVKSSTLRKYQFNERGDLSTRENREYVEAFLRDITDNKANLINPLITSGGGVSTTGYARISNALFAKVFKDSQLLETMADDPDNNIRIVSKALVKAAPQYAKVIDMMADGDLNEYDIVTPIVKACKILSELRGSNKPVSTAIAEQNIFTSETSIDPVTKDILVFFDKVKRSGKKMAEMINAAPQIVLEMGNPNQISLAGFEEETDLPTQAELFRTAIDSVLHEDQVVEGNEVDLFDQQDETTTDRPEGNQTPNLESNEGNTGENQEKQDESVTPDKDDNPFGDNAADELLNALGLKKQKDKTSNGPKLVVEKDELDAIFDNQENWLESMFDINSELNEQDDENGIYTYYLRGNGWYNPTRLVKIVVDAKTGETSVVLHEENGDTLYFDNYLDAAEALNKESYEEFVSWRLHNKRIIESNGLFTSRGVNLGFFVFEYSTRANLKGNGQDVYGLSLDLNQYVEATINVGTDKTVIDIAVSAEDADGMIPKGSAEFKNYSEAKRFLINLAPKEIQDIVNNGLDNKVSTNTSTIKTEQKKPQKTPKGTSTKGTSAKGTSTKSGSTKKTTGKGTTTTKPINLVDDSDEALAKLTQAFKKEASKLSANPMFNPNLYKIALQIGAIYLQRGANDFINWAKQLLKNLGEDIRPWLGAVWKSLQTYLKNMPSDQRINEEHLTAAVNYVGRQYHNGMHDPNEIFKTFVDLVGEEQAEPYRGLFDAAYAGIEEYYNHTMEVKGDDIHSDKTGDKGNTGSGDSEDRNGKDVDGRGPNTGDGKGSETSDKGGQSEDGSDGTDGSGSSSSGKTSNGQSKSQESGTGKSNSGSDDLSGRNFDSYERPISDEGKGLAEIIALIKEGQTNDAEIIKSTLKGKDKARYDEITQSMPFLQEGQKLDTILMERRLFDKKATGFLLTNGTGTGKTFSGLATIKRFVDKGKKRILILSPNDEINKQWVEAAKTFFGIDVNTLANTKDGGNDGVNITTYNNVGYNEAVASGDWDLIVADESQKLMENEDGNTTNSLDVVRTVTLHPTQIKERVFQLDASPEEKEARRYLRQLERVKKKLGNRNQGMADTLTYDPSIKNKDNQGKKSEENNEENEKGSLRKKEDGELSLNEQIEKAKEKFESYEPLEVQKARLAHEEQLKTIKDEDKPKVLFLSATPWAYEKDIDYTEGYLFKYGDGGREQYLINNFGYRMRYGKLTEPEENRYRPMYQMNFNENLAREGALSGRSIDVDKDYNRGFIVVDDGVGADIDEGFKFLYNNRKKYGSLYDVLLKSFDKRTKKYLLEYLKARESIPLIREYIASGKKVVVAHKSMKPQRIVNPFDFEKVNYKDLDALGKENWSKAKEEFKEFLLTAEGQKLLGLNLNDLKSPLETYAEAFGDEMVAYNGQNKKERHKNVVDFNNDDSGKNLIVVQVEAGSAGVNLHDTTGKHQRVLINIDIPNKPTQFSQMEGRIYRLGSKTNAIFRYLTTGMDMEKESWQDAVSPKAGGAENMALGLKARGLRESIKSAYGEVFDGSWQQRLPGMENEDIGGKQLDYDVQVTVNDYEGAKAEYYKQRKHNSHNKAEEGKDYYPTPEPLGYKMVEWADLDEGNSVLEPSAGHGAISQFFPQSVRPTIIEPNERLLTKAKFKLDEVKSIQGTFEEFNIINKFNAVIMNPPYGTSGKTAMEHVAKAFIHLKDGGRLLAIIPDGPAMDKRMNTWWSSPESKEAHLVAEVKLPKVTFNRAGTTVSTKLVVIDKHRDYKNMDLPEKTEYDLTGIQDIKELFDRLGNMALPHRIISDKNRVSAKDKLDPSYVEDEDATNEVTDEEEEETTDTYYEISDFEHTKTHEMLKRVAVTNTGFIADRNTWNQMAGLAKKHNGQYSKYAEGFLFRDPETKEEDAQAFAEELNDFLMGKFQGKVVRSGRRKRYSTVEEVKIQQTLANIEEEIKAVFKGSDVTNEGDGSFLVAMPNGMKIRVNVEGQIILNTNEQARAKAAHNLKGTGMLIEGFWQKLTKQDVDGVINLSLKGGQGSTFHETLHAAIALALTKQETKVLRDYCKAEAKRTGKKVDEVLAETFREWMMKRQKRQGTLLGKIWQKVLDWLNDMRNFFGKMEDAEDIMRKIATGKVWERTDVDTVRTGKRPQYQSFDKETKDTSLTTDNIQYSAIEEDDFTGPYADTQRLANVTKNSQPKSFWKQVKEDGYIKALRKKFYADWVDQEYPLQALIDRFAEAMGRPVTREENVRERATAITYNAAGISNALLNGTDDDITAINNHLMKNVKLPYKVTLQTVMDKIKKPLMDKMYPNYLKDAGFNTWHEAFSNYLLAKRLREMYDIRKEQYVQAIKEVKAEGKKPPKWEDWEYKLPNGIKREMLDRIIAMSPKPFEEASKLYYMLNDNLMALLEDGGLIDKTHHDNMNNKYKAYCPLMRDFSDTAAADAFLEGIGKGGTGIGNVNSPVYKIKEGGSERNLISPLESTYNAISIYAERCERNKVGQMAVEMSEKAGTVDLIVEMPEGTSPSSKESTFSVMFNGKKRIFQCEPSLHGPIAGYNVPAASMTFRVATMAANALRTGATMSPSFIVRNIFRDTFSAGVNSDNGFIPIVDTIKGMIALKKNPEITARFKAAGVDQFNFYGNGEARYKKLEEMTKESYWYQNPIKAIYNTFRGWAELGEAGTRMGEFMRALEKGKDDLRAAEDARDVTLNFTRMGAYGGQVNKVVPFFNACIQGGDKLIRTFHKDFVGTCVRTFKYIVLPSLFLWALNHDEDWYKELSPEMKNSYWFLGKTVKVPKPQEIGILFGSGVEMLLDEATNADPNAMKNWKDTLIGVMLPGAIPTAILPVVEWQANYNFFRQKEIVSQKLQRLPDREQYNSGTSEISKALGRLADLSPVKIDNTISSLTGTMGMFTWQLIGEPFSDKEEPERKWFERPFIRDFAVTDMNLGRSVNEFYEINNNAEKEYAAYGKKGRPSMAVKAIRAAYKSVSALNKDIRIIKEQKISPARKRELIDKKKALIKKIASKIVAKYGEHYL